jgi:hypothetical protein
VQNSRVFRYSGIRWGAASLTMLVADRFPQSTVAAVVKYSALAYLLLDAALTAFAGYRRRRPHWTRESWRRFFRACAIPLVALIVFWGMEAAAEFRLPIVGAARSTQRVIWIAIALVFMIVGAGGLGLAIAWLWEGDASAQFTRFQRRQQGPARR